MAKKYKICVPVNENSCRQIGKVAGWGGTGRKREGGWMRRTSGDAGGGAGENEKARWMPGFFRADVIDFGLSLSLSLPLPLSLGSAAVGSAIRG